MIASEIVELVIFASPLLVKNVPPLNPLTSLASDKFNV